MSFKYSMVAAALFRALLLHFFLDEHKHEPIIFRAMVLLCQRAVPADSSRTHVCGCVSFFRALTCIFFSAPLQRRVAAHRSNNHKSPFALVVVFLLSTRANSPGKRNRQHISLAQTHLCFYVAVCDMTRQRVSVQANLRGIHRHARFNRMNIQTAV